MNQLKKFFVLLFVGTLFAQDYDKEEIKSTSLQALKNELLLLEVDKLPEWHALLHYGKTRSHIHKKSSFFLHKNGYKDPKSEYLATIEEFFKDITQDSIESKIPQNKNHKNKQNLESKPLADSAVCRYPARMKLIYNALKQKAFIDSKSNSKLDSNLKTFENLINLESCKDLQDFLKIVPLDEIFIEFAGESNVYPGSSMGHIYLHFRGEMQNDVELDFEGNRLVRKAGDLQEYSMSYYAILSEFFNPIDYMRAIIGNLTGYYALEPYENLHKKYLVDQKRNIYRFSLQATKEQKQLFALHLWELKDKQIYYSFITHNCTNGIEEILGVLDSRNFYHSLKPFTTPAEFIKHLHQNNQITLQEILPAKNKIPFINHYGHNDILRSFKASKLTLGYTHKNQAFLSFAPIYSDIKSTDSSYYEYIESRIFAFEVGLAVDSKDLAPKDSQTHIFVPKLELTHLYSILDFYRTKTLSKLISFRLESNLYEYESNGYFQGSLNHSTRLFPTIDLGAGFGAYLGRFAFFALPFVGYRYEIIHNPYLALKTGIIARLPKTRVILDSNMFYDFIGNNRGYDMKLNLFVGINLYKQLDLFVESSVFWNLFSNTHLFYEKSNLWNLCSGISINF